MVLLVVVLQTMISNNMCKISSLVQNHISNNYLMLEVVSINSMISYSNINSINLNSKNSMEVVEMIGIKVISRGEVDERIFSREATTTENLIGMIIIGNNFKNIFFSIFLILS